MTVTRSLHDSLTTIDDFLEWWLHSASLEPAHEAVLGAYYRGYKTRFGRHVRHHYADQSREIEALIAQRPGARLLEIGAGCGTEALWFALRGCRVLSIDVDAERLAVARARQAVVERTLGRPLDLEFRLCSVFELGTEPAFDLVWMEQTFHHVEPRAELYAVLAALIRPGGHVVIADTNGWNPLFQVALLRKRGLRTVVDRTMPDGRRIYYGDERITVPEVLVRGFGHAGIVRRSVRYFRVLGNSALGDALMGLERLVPGWLRPVFTHYVYVGRRAAATDGQALTG